MPRAVFQISSKSDCKHPIYCTMSISNMAAAAILDLSLNFRFLHTLTKTVALSLCIKFYSIRSNGLWIIAFWLHSKWRRPPSWILHLRFKVLWFSHRGQRSLVVCKIWRKSSKKQRNGSIFTEIKDGGGRHLGFQSRRFGFSSDWCVVLFSMCVSNFIKIGQSTPELLHFVYFQYGRCRHLGLWFLLPVLTFLNHGLDFY